MQSLITREELIQCRLEWGQTAERIAFVPTMGALHEGHLSLVRQARAEAGRVLVSIFVNPAQFGPNEDFATYPRTLKADVDMLEQAGADAVFMPNATEIYPAGFQTYVVNDSMAEQLCGLSRPGHFRGVLTVVMKLLNLVQPDMAFFGKKDYQQWRLIETMAQDLAIPVQIVGCETLRELDGLAMSSRNRRLRPEERQKAILLFQGLEKARQMFERGERMASTLIQACRSLLDNDPAFTIDYVALHTQKQLTPITESCVESAVMLVAARLGDVRLIDNMEFNLAP